MLHIKYRPKIFNDVIGHSEIIKSLRSLLKEHEFPHAFLFSGPSGVGKTTIARIVANSLRRIEDPGNEIIEMNIANTTGIDFIRKLNESAMYTSIIGTNKVYILDEAQMLSKEGQNCLLKLLEDSPSHTYFIICTTDPQKLLLALRNRCHFYSLKKLIDPDIRKLLKIVAKKEELELNKDIEDLLIYKSDGCPRQALVYFNQIKDIDNFDEAISLLADEIEEEKDIIDLCRLLIKRPKTDWKSIMGIYNNIKAEPETIRIVIANYLATCMKRDKQPSKYVDMLELFLNPLTYSTGKAEILFLLYKSYFQ